MRALATDIAHIFFSLPVYLVFLLLAMSIMAFRKERNSMHFRWRFLYVALFGFFYMASAPVFSNALVNRIESIYSVPDIQDFRGSNQHVVLVLTAGWLRQTETGYETKIGEAGWERILTGVELWRHVGGNLLFTGAPAPDGKDSAAQAMARVARLMGVPGEAILLETR